MMARGFKAVGWVGTIGSAVLGCYILSSWVAEERSDLTDLERQIRRTEQSIQTLKTELGTRGRVHQLQHWASADFGFVTPTAAQFLDDEVTLASLDAPAEVPAMEAPVRMAQAPAPAAALPRLVQASAPVSVPAGRPAVRQAATERSAEPALLRSAAVVDAASAPVRERAVAARAPRPAAAAPARTANRAAALVDARTLRDIDDRANDERSAPRDSGRR